MHSYLTLDAGMERGSAPQTAGAGLLRLLTGANARDSAERAVARRLRLSDAQALRAAHPRLPAAVAALDWGWIDEHDTTVYLFVCSNRRAAARFAAALPRATCGAVIDVAPRDGCYAADIACAMHAVGELPPTIVAADINECPSRESAELVMRVCRRLRGLCDLRVPYRTLSNATLAALPPTLRRLGAYRARLPRGVRLDHLTALSILNVDGTAFDDAGLAALPRSLTHLSVGSCERLTAAARFGHLPALRKLDARQTGGGRRVACKHASPLARIVRLPDAAHCRGALWPPACPAQTKRCQHRDRRRVPRQHAAPPSLAVRAIHSADGGGVL